MRNIIKLSTLLTVTALLGVSANAQSSPDETALLDNRGAIIQSMKGENKTNRALLKGIKSDKDFLFLEDLVRSKGAFNNRSIRASGHQRNEMHQELMDSLANSMASWGLDKNRVKRLTKKGFNVVDRSEKVVLLEANVEDYIALSEAAKFGEVISRNFDEDSSEFITEIKFEDKKKPFVFRTNFTDPVNRINSGTECLFFSSVAFQQYVGRKKQKFSPFQFTPYCLEGNRFHTQSHYLTDKGYQKSELNEIISKFAK